MRAERARRGLPLGAAHALARELEAEEPDPRPRGHGPPLGSQSYFWTSGIARQQLVSTHRPRKT